MLRRASWIAHLIHHIVCAARIAVNSRGKVVCCPNRQYSPTRGQRKCGGVGYTTLESSDAVQPHLAACMHRTCVHTTFPSIGEPRSHNVAFSYGTPRGMVIFDENNRKPWNRLHCHRPPKCRGPVVQCDCKYFTHSIETDRSSHSSIVATTILCKQHVLARASYSAPNAPQRPKREKPSTPGEESWSFPEIDLCGSGTDASFPHVSEQG